MLNDAILFAQLLGTVRPEIGRLSECLALFLFENERMLCLALGDHRRRQHQREQHQCDRPDGIPSHPSPRSFAMTHGTSLYRFARQKSCQIRRQFSGTGVASSAGVVGPGPAPVFVPVRAFRELTHRETVVRR